jgi:subtilisin family serine protease
MRCLALSFVVMAGCIGDPEAALPVDRIQQGIAAKRRTVVLVTLRPAARAVRGRLAARELSAVARRNASFADSLDPAHATARHTMSTFAGGILEVDAEGYQALLARADVLAVEPDLPTTAHLHQSIPLIRASVTQADGNDGVGVAVAVLDTGVHSAHDDLVGAVLGTGYRSLGGTQDQHDGDAEDDQGHGSNVAGIIAARSGAGPGVAPGARIVPVKVLDSMERGVVSDWIAGIDWVVGHQNAFGTPIRVINMSLGTDDKTPSCPCDGTSPMMQAALDSARAAGILVVASSGNEGRTTELPYPACFSTVVAVAATYDANLGAQPDPNNDQTTYADAFAGSWPQCGDKTTTATKFACFSNRNSCVKLVAPGSQITSDGWISNSAHTTYIGTSQAAPHVAGMAAVLWGRYPNLSVDQVEAALYASTKAVTDPETQLTFAFLDAVDALAAAGCGSTCSASGACDAPTCGASATCEHHQAAPGAPCGDPVCTAGVRTAPSCNASGTCEVEPESCGPYQCNTEGTDCLVTCTLGTDCADGYRCASQLCGLDTGDGGGCQTGATGSPWLSLGSLALLWMCRRRGLRAPRS